MYWCNLNWYLEPSAASVQCSSYIDLKGVFTEIENFVRFSYWPPVAKQSWKWSRCEELYFLSSSCSFRVHIKTVHCCSSPTPVEESRTKWILRKASWSPRMPRERSNRVNLGPGETRYPYAKEAWFVIFLYKNEI